MLISSTIPNLINGVSQQPYMLRLASQCDKQENGYPTVAEGLKKRPPSVHVAKIYAMPLDNAFIHMINRDAAERYVVTISNGDLRVNSVNGTSHTVTIEPSAADYLLAASPETAFRAVTVADTTFILNTEVIVEKATTTSPARGYEALVYIKQGNYGKTYSISVNGVQKASYQTPTGSTAADSTYIDTNYIATQLETQLTANGVTCSRYGSVLHLTFTTDSSVTLYDGFNGNASELIKGTVQKFSDLPGNAPDGFVVEVAGDDLSSFDSYFVKFVKEKPADSTGIWQECVKPGVEVALDPVTMPHLLVRNADGTFTFKVAAWGDRLVGDDDSSPFPSFVGNTMSDMFFFRNRLGILSEENVIFSEAGEFFNFFLTTVTTLVDSDPIDIAVSHVKVSLLKHAVPFNEELLLFSGQTQFKLDTGDILTPKSVSINQTTEFECSTRTRPVGAGRNVFFCVNKGSFTGVREYFIASDTKTNDASDVTAHVPRYIPGNPVKLSASTNEDVVALLTEDDRTAIHLYKYYWSGDEKLQSAWGRWKFAAGGSILSAEFMDTFLYIVVSRADGVYLECIDIDLGSWDGMDTQYRVMLDRKVEITAGTAFEQAGATYTQITMPYAVTTTDFIAYVNSGVSRGELVDVLLLDGQPVLRGNHAGESLVVGQKYNFSYRFSTVAVKEQAMSGGVQTRITGRLQVRRFSVSYEGSGFFKATVTPKDRNAYVYTYSGKTLGSGNNILGEAVLGTGVFRFPVMARNTDVTIDIDNDTPLPLTMLNATWEGFYVDHAQKA